MADNITLPSEFSGAAQLLLYTRYGDPRELGWENKWITPWHIQLDFPWFPEENVTLHKHFKPILAKAFRALEDAGLHREIKACECCYELRNVHGSDVVLSVHAWGASMDLNSEENPIGSLGAWSPEFIKVMEDNEIYCGINWEGRKEPAHFAMVNG